MKVALIGYGKMGKEIEKVIAENGRGDEIILRITQQNRTHISIEDLKAADVAIEFTQPEAAVENIFWCLEAGVPIVTGTTGWFNRLEEVRKYCIEKNGALFYAPNFSIGVNIFFEVNKKLASLMQSQMQYSVCIEETHHTEKKDAPSGTAIKTAEVILETAPRFEQWKSEPEKIYSQKYIPIVAYRQPHVPGTHMVAYKSAVDEITLTHQAFSRRGFAEGAVAAARWLIGRKGAFEMKDLLSL
ncbi:MAG: 4-hydroxy-tetrahydrodipicolinate reductase [Chitinophagales bacterium]|nr:4-hydroxy-tetrahydrodipicolinate reductase [Chitinophagales bacterium]MDW8272860.1 4-hydroxy-tetrahydrodipicolinate reductase [Chitinophagales bacterium]